MRSSSIYGSTNKKFSENDKLMRPYHFTLLPNNLLNKLPVITIATKFFIGLRFLLVMIQGRPDLSVTKLPMIY